MEIATIVFLIVIAIYVIVMSYLIIGFFSVKAFENRDLKSLHKFSIIVPFRNESQRISSLLLSLTDLKYDHNLYEIIFVDDDSSDNTTDLIKNFEGLPPNFSIINNVRKSNAPKKDAIETAISQSKFDWIVTTDADCYVDPNWLKILNDYIQIHKPKMVCGGVSMVASPTFIEQFQQFEFLGLQGATIGAFGRNKPILCNGANLAYAKNTFYEVNGFEDNNEIASGDDIFMLEKIRIKYPNDVHYLKHDSFIVLTQTEKNWNQLINQKIRWASKNGKSQSSLNKLVAFSVAIGNLAIVVGLFCWGFNILSFSIFYWGFAAKVLVDTILIVLAGRYLKPSKTRFYLASLALYPFYFMMIGVFSLMQKYEWKGRVFKN